MRVRCFGAGEVWYGDRLLELHNPELLLLFGVHPITGIKNEALADMLFKKAPADIAAALRKERHDLRTELRRLVPELAGDPLPGNEYQGEKVIALDPALVSSDVHEFNQLLQGVEKLDPAAAIEAYEAALRLYRGDLLDNRRCSTTGGCTTKSPRSRLPSAATISFDTKKPGYGWLSCWPKGPSPG